MSVLSPFQQLPLDIAVVVVDYLETECSYTDSSPGPKCTRNPELLIPLLSSCHVWRQAAVKRAFELQTVSLEPHVETHLRPSSYRHLARALTVRIPSLIAALGQQDSSSAIQYVNVRSLSVEISMHAGDRIQAESCIFPQSSVNRLVQYIRQKAPNAESVKVSLQKATNVTSATPEFQQCVSTLLTGLFYEMRSVRLTSDSNFSSEFSQVSVSPGITSLDLDYIVPASQLRDLVQKHSSTLRVLRIKTLLPAAASALFVDDNGQAVVYSCLEQLQFAQHRIYGIPRLPSHIEQLSVPFPNLKSLIVERAYLFSTDILFRGNLANLQRLHLHIDGNFIENRLFPLDGPAQVRDLCLEISPLAYPLSDEFVSAATQVALGIVSASRSSLRSLSLPSEFSKPMVVEILARGNPMFTSLNVLNINHVALEVSDIIALLTKLGRLQHLSCMVSIPDSGGCSESALEQITDYYSNTLYPLNQTLSSWKIQSSNRHVEDVVSLSLLLALACPRLTSIHYLAQPRCHFDSLVRERLGNKPFSRYSNRLCQLIQ
ncbi:hypothetical protein LPJ53_000839 [Coemansia erecta]|uniref:Uncharacterized protein n=1 Tax=Coemansia erecta TaxID=147472 RepID=A0A9W8CSR4_9FUNG|nr:hypothetical protein LPJ53_000839 [Coemansia erecta]